MNSESNNNIERIDDEENTVIIQDSENTNNAQADNQPQAIAVKKKLPLSSVSILLSVVISSFLSVLIVFISFILRFYYVCEYRVERVLRIV